MLNEFKTVILLGLLTGLMLFVGYIIGGPLGLTVALLISLLMNFISYWFSDKIVLAMYSARKIEQKDNPELFNMVLEVSKKAKLPMPKVYIIPTQTPNAFATGRNYSHSAVAFTQGILNLLNDDELKGVIAHELSHIKNRDTLIQTVAATIAGVISYVATMAQYAAMFGGFGSDDDGPSIIGVIILAILTPIIAMLLQLALSRSREYIADESAAEFLRDSKGLANALLKLDEGIAKNPMKIGNQSTSSLFIANPFSSKGFFSLLSTHPPMEERIKRLKKIHF